MVSPGAAVVTDAVFDTASSAGQTTSTVAVALLFPVSAAASLSAAAVAVLVSVPQSAASVVPVSVTLTDPSGSRSPKAQSSTWPVSPTSGSMAQSSLSSAQSTPSGKSSVRVTLRAMPSPPLVTVIAKLAGSPALTGP